MVQIASHTHECAAIIRNPHSPVRLKASLTGLVISVNCNHQLSGKEPSPATVGARIACISSYYKFLVRMDLIRSNPCDRLDRPRTSPAVPRGLSADEVRRLLSVIPDTQAGLRDRAIVLTLVLTGRRRSEVLNLTTGDIESGEPAYYRYRGKGGKRGRRELPRPAYAATVRALAAFGKEMATMGHLSRCGPRVAAKGLFRRGPSTAISAATCARRGCRLLGFMSPGILLRS